MGIKTILVPIDGGKGSFAALDRAIVVADRFGSHIKALHVMSRASDVASAGFFNIPAKLRKTAEIEADKVAMERATELQQQFEALCAQRGIPISERPAGQGGVTAVWHQEFGHIEAVLIRHGRVSDAIAVSRPNLRKETMRRSPVGEVVEALLMSTGRPVLVTPPECPAMKCERVAIGWNDSVECSRALAMTMPWLVEMKEITVLVSQAKESSVKAMIEYLAWHNVKADIQLLDGRGKSDGEAILNVCTEIGAEFLIVGGFSHARARELWFGGVTHHLLAHSNIAVIMVH